MTCLEQNKVDWSLFQQGVFQNQSTELNLHSNGTVKWLLVEVIWVFLVKFQFILLPYKYFLSTRMQHFINFIAQTFKFIISKGILTTEAKKKNPKKPRPFSSPWLLQWGKANSVMVFPSAVFKIPVLIKYFIQTVFFQLQRWQSYTSKSTSLHIFTFISPNHNVPTAGWDFLGMTKVSLLFKIQVFKNWVYLYQPDKRHTVDHFVYCFRNILNTLLLLPSLKALACSSERTNNF